MSDELPEEQVVLTYSGDIKAQVYSGEIRHQWNGGVHHELDFGKASFKAMMQSVSGSLNRHPDAGLVMYRQENPGVPYVMDEKTVQRLRENPEQVIEEMSPPPVRINIGGDTELKDVMVKDQTQVVKREPLPAGHDVLAGAFGDVIYCRMKRGGTAECPCCGRWGHVTCDENKNGYLRCKSCGTAILGKAYPREDGGWWGIDIRVLLEETDSKRFFLPLKWNESGPWISHEDLKKRYEKYLEEKSDVRKQVEST